MVWYLMIILLVTSLWFPAEYWFQRKRNKNYLHHSKLLLLQWVELFPYMKSLRVTIKTPGMFSTPLEPFPTSTCLQQLVWAKATLNVAWDLVEEGFEFSLVPWWPWVSNEEIFEYLFGQYINISHNANNTYTQDYKYPCKLSSYRVS